MKKQNKDAADSMSALEITAKAMYLLMREYSGNEKSENDLHLDLVNAANAIQSLKLIHIRIIDIKRIRRQAALAEAPFD